MTNQYLKRKILYLMLGLHGAHGMRIISRRGKSIVGKHTIYIDKFLKRFPTHDQGAARQTIEDLIRDGIIARVPKKHNGKIFIPREKIEAAKKIALG